MERNGWLFRPFKRFWHGMIYGHDWIAKSPAFLPHCPYQAQECKVCGKRRVV